MAPPAGPPTPIGILGIEGRNGYDSTFMIPDNQCREAMNVDWYGSALGRKRPGAETLSLATGGTAFASGVVAGGRFVPGSDLTAAEMWTLDGAFNFHRLAGSAVWASPTVLHACTATPQEALFVPFRGKLIVPYKSAVNRLHLWDGLTLRAMGIALPATPVINKAAGAITDTRRYRMAWTKQVAGVTVSRSNLSVATASQALVAQQASADRPALPGEGETHWELYASTSPFGDYRLQGTATVATAAIVDNIALSSDVAPDDGANTPPPSAKYVVADDARLIMAGAYETAAGDAMTPSAFRVWWSSLISSSSLEEGDMERVSNTGTINNYADVEEAITGISAPMQVVSAAATSLERGSFYVFSSTSQWKFIATGVAAAPYIHFRITGGGGCVHHKSIVTAIDVNGSPAIYWWSPDGPMRISVAGQEFLGADVQDITDDINLDATIPCHAVYHSALRQVWFYVATGSNLYPNKKVIFDTALGRVTESTGVRFGWAVHEGESTKAYCSFLFSTTVGATMSRKLKPYVGYSGGTAIWKCDSATATDDAGTAFAAYIESKSYSPWGVHHKGGVPDSPILMAQSSPGVPISLTIYRNEGAEESSSTTTLTDYSGSGAAEMVFPQFEDARLGDSFTFRCRIGDAQALSNGWNLQGLVVPVQAQGDH